MRVWHEAIPATSPKAQSALSAQGSGSTLCFCDVEGEINVYIHLLQICNIQHFWPPATFSISLCPYFKITTDKKQNMTQRVLGTSLE